MRETYISKLSWDKIDWKTHYDIVRRIQRRIYKASLKSNEETDAKVRTKCRKRIWFLQKMLIKSPHAKLIAVQKATTLNKGRTTPGIDGYIATTAEQKIKMADNLYINGKSNNIRRIWIPKPGKLEKRPLGIPTIHDRAKQALAHMALEPEWEAKFDENSYGFRPGRRPHDAIEAIFLNLRKKKNKYVYDADIRKCFDRINHDALLKKIETFPLMEMQIKSWLKSGIFDELSNEPKTTIPNMGTPQGGIISPLLCNIALNKLEEHLLEFVSDLEIKPNPNTVRGKRAKRQALGFIRYADDFVIIHENEEIIKLVIEETKQWLSLIGLEISEEKTKLRKAANSFDFLGFSITLIKQKQEYKVKITPSKKNCKAIIEKISTIITRNKASSSYVLISKLRPVILGWGNYFKYCESSKTFNSIDNIIYQQLRSWVFRRAIRQGRQKVKSKYFPEGKIYTFQGRRHKANWILNGSQLKGNKIVDNHLPKLQWIKKEKYAKVLGKSSIYDGNEIYWAIRTPIHSTYSTRVKNLLRIQRGTCKYCNNKFTITDKLEVDHILPKFKGGTDNYNNLQVLHKYCHALKTKKDN